MSHTAREKTPVQHLVSEEEWQARVNLAAAYRLVAYYGWDDLIFTHLSARVPGPEHHFLINPYGMMFEEITASSLVKINLQGEIVSASPFFVNPAGFTIHSAVHAAALASLSYHEYEGLALNEDEKSRLVADLGNNNNLILANHGLLTVGRTPAEAFLSMYILESACRIQILAQSGGGDLIPIADPILEKVASQLSAVTVGQGAQLAWPGLLRKLDRLDPSYRE
jgi:ribulose-5-phosphate 4-epimerase/fuculose-1-phosphate aldolase